MTQLIFCNYTDYLLKKYCLFYFRFSQSQISVRLGEYDFTTQGETGEQTYTLSGMKMHENYDPKTFENDIAILKLSQDAQFTQSVQPACLPIGDSDYNNVKVNKPYFCNIYLLFFSGLKSSNLCGHP